MEMQRIRWEGIPVLDSTREKGVVVGCTIGVRSQKVRTMASDIGLWGL